MISGATFARHHRLQRIIVEKSPSHFSFVPAASNRSQGQIQPYLRDHARPQIAGASHLPAFDVVRARAGGGRGARAVLATGCAQRSRSRRARTRGGALLDGSSSYPDNRLTLNIRGRKLTILQPTGRNNPQQMKCDKNAPGRPLVVLEVPRPAGHSELEFISTSSLIWRDLNSAFRSLVDEETAAFQQLRGDVWLRGYWHRADGGSDYGINGGRMGTEFRERFNAIAIEAGKAKGAPPDADPLAYWLECLYQTAYEHKAVSQRGPAFKLGDESGGIIQYVCEASAWYCKHLEAEALTREHTTGTPGSVQTMRPPGDELDSAEFISACEKLRRLFAGVLWDAKVNSCSTAWSDVKRAKNANKKKEIFNQKAHQWREDSAKAIRAWVPKFVALAEAYFGAVDGDPLHWAKEQVWGAVEAQCGIVRPRQSGLPRVDYVSRTMVYWFAVASEGDFEVNVSPQRPWIAPHWLARNEREADSLLRDHGRNLGLRLNHVIGEEFDLAGVQRAINRSNQQHQYTQGTARRVSGIPRARTPLESGRSGRIMKKLGRPRRLSIKFVEFAAKLWSDAQRHNGHTTVADDQLAEIATKLDIQGFSPPALYLEKSFAQEVKAFNSRNSNSKRGVILTWSQLVGLGDKDHLRGMRRLLSRCAHGLSSNSLSGN